MCFISARVPSTQNSWLIHCELIDIHTKAVYETNTDRCAIGAAFNNSRYPELPCPLNEFFAKRAKALIDIELDMPRIATIQSLAVLSIHEASATRDTRGWLFSGMILYLNPS